MNIVETREKRRPMAVIFSVAIPTLMLGIYLMTCLPLVNAQEVSYGSYVYVLDNNGLAHVTLVVQNTEGMYEMYLRVEPGTIKSSLIAFDSAGNLLPVSFLNDTLVMIFLANSTNTVVVTYSAVIGNNVGGVIQAMITPYGNATVKLPKGAALLYFDDDPVIEIVDSSITLYYTINGIYNITYIAPPSETTTTTTPPQTTTTTLPETTTIPPFTTTTTQPTTTAPPQTTTEAPETTTAPFTTSTTITTSATTTTTTTVTTTTTTTTTPPITTVMTTNTATTTTDTTEEARPAEGGIPITMFALAAVAAVAVALFLLLKSKSRKRGSGKAVPIGGGTPPPPPRPSIPEHTELSPTDLDERDIMLMRAIGESGETTISELAKRTGLSKSVVWRRVRKLTDLGMISKEDIGAKSILRLTEKGKEIIGGSA